MNTPPSTISPNNAPCSDSQRQSHCDTEMLHQILGGYARDAYQAIRDAEESIRWFETTPLPAPKVYDLLADLKSLGYVLGHVLTRIAANLNASHKAYDLFNDDATDPTDTLAEAADCFDAATLHAHQIGRALDDCQAALSVQGYRITEPSRAARPAHDDENGDLS